MAAMLTSPSHVILIDNSTEKFGIIPKGLATHTICSKGMGEGEVAAKIKELTGGEGVDYAIDCVGTGALLKEGHTALCTGGTLVTVGGHSGNPQFEIGQHLVRGITYLGTHQGGSVSRIVSPKCCF